MRTLGLGWHRLKRSVWWALLVAGVLVGCSAPQGAVHWPPRAKKWFDRAEASYRNGDVEDADTAVKNAIRLLPNEESVLLLAARVALAKLEYDRAVRLLVGMRSAEAAGIRGRALWYAGSMAQAADELERMLADPDVRDPWATDVTKLARLGVGREPFRMSGGLLAVTEMPRVRNGAWVVPLELDGEPALAMISTATAEVVIDSSRGAEPKWVSLRFGERIEIHDVPAVAKDLSGVSRQVGAPIKLLVGVNLLRHMHPTIDYAGDQFVVRTFEPPAPPSATTVPIYYLHGGGMLVRPALGLEDTAPRVALLVDTSLGFPVALDADGWKQAGVDAKTLKSVPSAGQLHRGVLPLLRLGAFELPKVSGFYGVPIAQVEKQLGVDLAGFVGSELMAAFRVTLADDGKTLWLENHPLAPDAVPAAPTPPASSVLPSGAQADKDSNPALILPTNPSANTP